MIALNRIGCVDKFADCRSILKIFRKTLPVVAPGFDYYGVFDNKPPVIADINMDIYEDMKEKLKDLVEEKTGEGFVQISAPWAMDIMTSRIDGTKPQAQ